MFRRTDRQSYPFGGVAPGDDRDIEERRLAREARRHFWAEARLLTRDLFVALMIATLAIVFVVQPVKVEGSSMLPRLHGCTAATEDCERDPAQDHSDRIFVNKLIYYGLPELERGDIVVFWYPDDPSKSYIKRIIGVPGETVSVCDNRVLVNGRPLEEPYLDPRRNVGRYSISASDAQECDPRPGCQGCVYVKAHHFFVMGDNRDNSSDSRSWGLVPEKYIYGKALFRYWPLSEASVIRHEVE